VAKPSGPAAAAAAAGAAGTEGRVTATAAAKEAASSFRNFMAGSVFLIESYQLEFLHRT
jgi:hypothetical protein